MSQQEVSPQDIESVKAYFIGLQDEICDKLEAVDGKSRFIEESWQRPEGGGGRSRVIEQGGIFEKGGVNFSHVRGDAMPGSATAHRPELAGRSFQAMGVSLVMHPENPHIPTSHANVRFFIAEKPDKPPVWWFGGGYDLTPYYLNENDAIHWHTVAKQACDPFGKDVYPGFKKWCDEYFYLKHRGESRGIGGLFFDDLNDWGFENCFGLVRSVGDSYTEAYLPVIDNNREKTWSEQQKYYQLYRRGRYVEFNLVYDRGTLFGLQTGGRTESILMSLPPLVRWDYNRAPEPGTEEAKLLEVLKTPREWI